MRSFRAIRSLSFSCFVYPRRLCASNLLALTAGPLFMDSYSLRSAETRDVASSRRLSRERNFPSLSGSISSSALRSAILSSPNLSSWLSTGTSLERNFTVAMLDPPDASVSLFSSRSESSLDRSCVPA